MPNPLVSLHIARIDDLQWPASDRWLSAAERDELARMKAPRRRSEWLAGRWLGKQAIIATSDLVTFDQVSISTYCRVTRRGLAPRIIVGGNVWRGALSIAHADGWVAVACHGDGRPVGVDLASVQTLSTSFGECWFTPSEQAALAGQGELAALRYWVAKEALFKAIGHGRQFRPQEYELQHNHDDGLSPAHAPGMALTEFECPVGLLTVAAFHECSITSVGCVTPLRSFLTKVYA